MNPFCEIAVEEAIRYFLGENDLHAIQDLYENEFTSRILQSREH